MPLREDHVYIIAEAGSNHYGNLDHAFRLIETAAAAGADACKFQLFRLADILRNPDGNGRPGECGDPRTELPPDWVPALSGKCHAAGIDFLCTPFSAWAVDILNPYVWAWKIGSFEHKRDDIWHACMGTGKPIIASRGREPGVMTHPAAYNLYCVSKYPCDQSDIMLPNFSASTNGWYQGLSDHTMSTVVPALAAARGARIIEKHFRLDETPPESPDHSFALAPAQLVEMVANIRLAEEVCKPKPHVMMDYPNRREE